MKLIFYVQCERCEQYIESDKQEANEFHCQGLNRHKWKTKEINDDFEKVLAKANAEFDKLVSGEYKPKVVIEEDGKSHYRIKIE